MLLGIALLQACAGQGRWQPGDSLELTGIQTQSIEDVTASVAILTDQQASRYFGLDLGGNKLQAVWLSVRNASPYTLWFMRNALDPDFYSPDEVALVLGNTLNAEETQRARQMLRDRSVRVQMEPGMITEGFVFLPKVEGGRYVDIRLAPDSYAVETARQQSGNAALEHAYLELRFGFAMPLPDGIFDYERLDPEHTYGDRELPNLPEQAFRSTLEALPCCLQNNDGLAQGDPLNLVIVGSANHVLNTLSRAGWSFTHRITFKSISKTIGAALSGEGYPVAPVSNLYLFDRKQDFALQRARRSIAQRNHLRLWLAPFRFRGQPVWVGQVSRDIGIKLTPKAPTLTTHVIDPEVDLTREYFLHSVLAAGFVDRFGFVKGARYAMRETPASNLTGDPYFSDGMRLVVVLSPEPVSYREVRNLLWEQSAAPVAEGQSDQASHGVRPIPPSTE